tara:strand:+ start:676 stop:1047 length:372 start_codon:yes stop_codon:yes gene_type:complete
MKKLIPVLLLILFSSSILAHSNQWLCKGGLWTNENGTSTSWPLTMHWDSHLAQIWEYGKNPIYYQSDDHVIWFENNLSHPNVPVGAFMTYFFDINTKLLRTTSYLIDGRTFLYKDHCVPLSKS